MLQAAAMRQFQHTWWCLRFPQWRAEGSGVETSDNQEAEAMDRDEDRLTPTSRPLQGAFLIPPVLPVVLISPKYSNRS
jgi:hypothetical protein